MSRRLAWWLLMAGIVVAGVSAVGQDEPVPPPATQPTSQPTSQPTTRRARASDAEVLATLQERLPLRYQRLMELRQTAPEDYSRHLDRMRRWYEDWRRMPPAIQDADVLQQVMNVRVWQLVDKLRQGDSDTDKAELQEQLRQAVAKQFEAETVVMGYRLEMLEQGLVRMCEHLAERREKVENFISERVDRLLRASTQPSDDREAQRRLQEEPASPFPPGGRPGADGPEGPRGRPGRGDRSAPP